MAGTTSLTEALAVLLWHTDSVRSVDMDLPDIGRTVATMQRDDSNEFIVELAVPTDSGDSVITSYLITVKEAGG